ncbi:MAG: trigger factor [Chryseolinea sp.]
MEITLNKTNNTEGLIKIILTEGDYQPTVDEKLKDYARKATIKGFRQGKVPTGVIKKMFGKSILVEEINQLLSHKLSDYIKENKIKILGEPIPNHEMASSIDWDVQKNFEFEYQIGMVEDFTYDLSTKAKVKSFIIEVDDKTIQETISDLKKRFGKVTNPEQADAETNLFGELRSISGDLKRENALIAVDKVIPEQQSKFIGIKKEDEVTFDINAVFADADAKSQLLGELEDGTNDIKGEFVLKVGTLSKTEPSELNIEFYDRVFGKDVVTNEEEFVAKIRGTIAENYKRESDHFLEHHIEDYFISNTEVHLPDDFLKTWLKNSSQGKVTDDVLAQEYEDYKRGLKWDLIKNRIADDNNIKVETDEVRAKAKDLIISQFGGQAFASQISDRLDGIADNYLQNENGQNFMKLYNQLRSERILKHVRDNITVEDQNVTVEEFKKIVSEHKH